MAANDLIQQAIALRAKQRAEEQAAANARAAVTDQSMPFWQQGMNDTAVKGIEAYAGQAAHHFVDQGGRSLRGLAKLLTPNTQSDNVMDQMAAFSQANPSDTINAAGDAYYGVRNALLAPIDPYVQGVVRGASERLTAGQPEGASAPGMGVLGTLDEIGTGIEGLTGITKQNQLDALTWHGGELVHAGAKLAAPTVKAVTKKVAGEVAKAAAPVAERLAKAIIGDRQNVIGMPNAKVMPDHMSKDWFSNANSQIEAARPKVEPHMATWDQGLRDADARMRTPEYKAEMDAWRTARDAKQRADTTPMPLEEAAGAKPDVNSENWFEAAKDNITDRLGPMTWGKRLFGGEDKAPFELPTNADRGGLNEGQRFNARKRENDLMLEDGYDANARKPVDDYQTGYKAPDEWSPQPWNSGMSEPVRNNIIDTNYNQLQTIEATNAARRNTGKRPTPKQVTQDGELTPYGEATVHPQEEPNGALASQRNDIRKGMDLGKASDWDSNMAFTPSELNPRNNPKAPTPVESFDGNFLSTEPSAERAVTHEAGLSTNIGKDGRTSPGTITHWENPTEDGRPTGFPETVIVTNPTLKAAKKVADQSDWGEVRYLIDPDTGDVHLWPSDHGYHDDAATFMGRDGGSDGMFHGSFGVNELKQAMKNGSKTFEEAVYDMRRLNPDTIGSPENGWAEQAGFTHATWDQARANSDARHGGPLPNLQQQTANAVGDAGTAAAPIKLKGFGPDSAKPAAAAPIDGAGSPAKLWAEALAKRKTKGPYTRVGAQRGEVKASGASGPKKNIDDLRGEYLWRTSDERVFEGNKTGKRGRGPRTGETTYSNNMTEGDPAVLRDDPHAWRDAKSIKYSAPSKPGALPEGTGVAKGLGKVTSGIEDIVETPNNRWAREADDNAYLHDLNAKISDRMFEDKASPVEMFDGNKPEVKPTPEQKMSQQRTGDLLSYKDTQPKASAPQRAGDIREVQYREWLDPNRPLFGPQKIAKDGPKELSDLAQARDGVKTRHKYNETLAKLKEKVGDDFVKERVAAFPKTETPIVTTDILAKRVNKALEDHIAMSPEQRFVNYDAAVESLRDIWPTSKKGGVFNFLSPNKKLKKNSEGYLGGEPVALPNGQGVESTGLTLTPATNFKGFKTCVKFGACEKLCLGLTSGGNRRYAAVRILQGKRTAAVLDRSEAAAVNIFEEIVAARNKAMRNGNQLTVRMNVLSDVHPKVWKPLIEHFDDVIFIDYTKSRNLPISPNHHLTYSSSGVSNDMVSSLNADWELMSRHLDEGNNVAMAFSTKKSWPKWVYDEARGKVRRVVDGVSSDFRINDAQKPGHEGVIVGLKNMDETSKSADYNRNVEPHEDASVTSEGFFVHYDPKRTDYKGGKTILDPEGNPIPPGDIAYIPKQVSSKSVREEGKRVQINKTDALGNVETTYARDMVAGGRGIGVAGDKSTWRTPEGEERAALVAQRKAFLDEHRPLVAKSAGGLSGKDVETFRKFGDDIGSLNWKLAAPASAKTIKPNSMLGDLNPETLAGAYNAMISLPEDTFKAVNQSTMGVKMGAETEVDAIMRGKMPSTSAQEFYDAFQPTRDALREQYGDTITLYRSPGKQMSKPTANWAMTSEFAKQFGPKVVKREIPIDDVIAIQTSRDGNYHEFIVGSPPKEGLTRNAISRETKTPREPTEPMTASQIFGKREPKQGDLFGKLPKQDKPTTTNDKGSPERAQMAQLLMRKFNTWNNLEDRKALSEEFNVPDWQKIRGQMDLNVKDDPFRADYYNNTDVRGNDLKRGEKLTTTMDGDPINPNAKPNHIVVGRQKAGGKNVPLSPSKVLGLAKSIVEGLSRGHRPFRVTRDGKERSYGSLHGGVLRSSPGLTTAGGRLLEAGDYIPSKINVNTKLSRSKNDQHLTQSHELGHVMDFLSYDKNNREFIVKKHNEASPDYANTADGLSPNDRILHWARTNVPQQVRNQIEMIYSETKGTKNDAGLQSFHTTKDEGYSADNEQAEQFAEAFNMYLNNPGYIKKQYPEAAKYLRQIINKHPDFIDHVTLNSLGATAGGGGLAAWMASQKSGDNQTTRKEY